jgi:hypothetical protein
MTFDTVNFAPYMSVLMLMLKVSIIVLVLANYS